MLPEDDYTAETVTFDNVDVLQETEYALRVIVENEELWIPKSQIDEESEVQDKESSGGELIITKWLAKKKSLI